MNSRQGSSRGWILTLSAAVFVAAYVLVGLVPTQKSIASLRRELKEKRQFLANADVQATSQNGLDQQLESTRQYIDHWRNESPKDRNLIDLVGKIAAVAKETGVTIQKLSPRDPTMMAVMRQHSFNIEMVGDFERIMTFLARIEELPGTLWLHTLHMHPTEETGSIVQCTVILIVFADNRDNSG